MLMPGHLLRNVRDCILSKGLSNNWVTLYIRSLNEFGNSITNDIFLIDLEMFTMLGIHYGRESAKCYCLQEYEISL